MPCDMSVYETRTHEGDLAHVPGDTADTLFINERFEDQELQTAHYAQCTFANVSFKGSRLADSTFTACVFERCYFRKTRVDNCRFPATRFIECEFVKPTMVGCDFSHARFSRCAPPFRELQTCLPGPSNLKADLANNLATECEAIGQPREARLFRITARKAREEDLWAAVRHENDYYRRHYDTLDRLVAGWHLIQSRVNGALWGYGERAQVLLRNLAIAALGVFPIIFLLTGSDIRSGVTNVNYWDCLLLSVASLFNSPSVTGLTMTGWARVWVLGETAVGFVILGLYVAYLLRWITRR